MAGLRRVARNTTLILRMVRPLPDGIRSGELSITSIQKAYSVLSLLRLERRLIIFSVQVDSLQAGRLSKARNTSSARRVL